MKRLPFIGGVMWLFLAAGFVSVLSLQGLHAGGCPNEKIKMDPTKRCGPSYPIYPQARCSTYYPSACNSIIIKTTDNPPLNLVFGQGSSAELQNEIVCYKFFRCTYDPMTMFCTRQPEETFYQLEYYGVECTSDLADIKIENAVP